MIFRSCISAIAALACAAQVLASDTAAFECTSEGSPKYETGLGSGVDDLVYVPSRLRSNTRTLQTKGWRFAFGAGAYTYRDDKLVTIKQGASELNMTAQFSHEIGHANYAYKPDLSSRDAYIRGACTDEGRGLIENVVAHKAMYTCAASYLGVVTAEVDFFLAKYEELAQRPPILPTEIGYMFCERNRAPTGETYIDYYGKWYDANHSLPKAMSTPDIDPVLWDQMSRIADAGTHGAVALRAVWPMSPTLPARDVSRDWRGGASRLSPTIVLRSSEIRADDDGNVVIASMKLDGRCISRAEIIQHYPALEITQPPRAHGPQRTVYSAFGTWGELMFAIPAENPDCVDGISLHPHPDPYESLPTSD